MSADASPTPRGHILATGLGATVAMWAVAYVAMMRPGVAVSELLFGVTLLCPLAAGWIVGRHAAGGLVTGLAVGGVSAAFNLLLIGSVVGSQGADGGSPLTAGLMWIAGLFVVSMALAAAGAVVGARHRSPGMGRNWFNAFVCVAAAAVFLLLITGGLVTGLEAGLAVPDWPRTFGHNMLLYPLSEMTGGVYYEHAHRLYGMLVGLTTIVLVINLFRFDDRGWLRALGIVVLIMVCAQGVMGGLRVTGHLTMSEDPIAMRPNLPLAITHGVFGQVVFAVIVAIAAFTSTTWRSKVPATWTGVISTDRTWSAVLLALVLGQLVLGAFYRHMNADPEIATGVRHGILAGHLLMAGAVTALVIFAGGRAWARGPAAPVLARVGGALLILVAVQVALGVGALLVVLMRGDETAIPTLEVALTSAHQATGALLLAAATLLVCWTGVAGREG